VARLSKDTESHGIRQSAGSLQILTATPDHLRMRLADAAKWLRHHRRRENDWIPCDPPAELANLLLSIVGEWSHTPYLRGIVQAPALRPDGTVLQVPGYDPASGLYFDNAGTEFTQIPDTPTRTDAEDALAKLLDIISTFPYIDDASKSVMLTTMITPLCRHAMRSAPLFGFSAPKAGSGKTLQSYLPAYIATGLMPRLFSLPTSAEEAKKRYLAMLSEGAPVTVIDNVERPLKDDALCTILSEPVWSERILGSNRTLSVSTATTWIATGNALRVDGDLSSRSLLCTIDPAVERPEEREFKIDLHVEVPRRRGELAAASLTVVRAYIAANRPKHDIKPFGRFEDWSRLVREPLIWLGMIDPCDTRATVQAQDTVRENLAGLLIAWHTVFGSDAQTISEVLTKLKKLEDLVCANRDELQTLDAAIRDVAANRGEIDSRRLGTYIARYERRIESGLRFEKAGTQGTRLKWRVV
jgi:hypothetical protein